MLLLCMCDHSNHVYKKWTLSAYPSNLARATSVNVNVWTCVYDNTSNCRTALLATLVGQLSPVKQVTLLCNHSGRTIHVTMF